MKPASCQGLETTGFRKTQRTLPMLLLGGPTVPMTLLAGPIVPMILLGGPAVPIVVLV